MRSEIGSRLREERERLGQTQADFAALGGASKRSQIEWEKGGQTPNAEFLAKVGLQGVDVQYILTGTRAMSAQVLDEELRRYGDAWETLELALVKFDRTLAPEKKRKAADALYRASKQQTASQEQLTSLVLDLAA